MNKNLFTYTEFLKHKILSGEKATVAYHNHNCFELSYYISGTGQLVVGNTVYNFKPHSVFITPPAFAHSLLSENLEVLYIGFFYDNSLGVINREIFIENTQSDDILTILKLMESMYESKNDKLTNATLFELQKLIIYTILDIQLTNEASSSKDIFANVAFSLKQNFSKDVDFEKIAMNSGYSYHRFRHLFKEKYGVSPRQFHLNEKIYNSMQMLISTSQSIESIAMCCGFKSTANYISLFKKHNKLSPTQYRNSVKKNIETYNYFDTH